MIEPLQVERVPYPIYNDAEINKFLKQDIALNADLSIKGNLLKSMAGALKGTDLDNDDIWRKALKKKSRRKSITL